MASGLAGAAGVALAAAGAHGGNGGLETAGLLLVMHAAAVLALAGRGGAYALAAAVLLGGSVLFAGDLTARAYFDTRLFPYAAPTGGVMMIAGWLGVALTALRGRG
ncbi:hypothetical protein BV133_341 [Blastochloris viridis]|uniref:DUF423 domain-containing protein n=1 Tax=Blastochloris viridis TaxID=1079 RepID=A0A182CXU4_BLAVI|nr:hypothetical protein BV133_341 [Blastochloris viridis]